MLSHFGCIHLYRTRFVVLWKNQLQGALYYYLTVKVALRFSGVNFVSLNFIDYVSMAFVWETIASGTPAIYWTCRKRWDSADEVASEGCGWTHPFDLLLSRILTSCAEQELHLRQEDAYSDGIK